MPVETLDHDFLVEALGKATSYGVYDVFKNRGFVNVGLSCEMAVFVVESLWGWWYVEGSFEYVGAEEIVLTCDCGGGNGYCSWLWEFEFSKFVCEVGLSVRVLYFPSGTSKWYKVERRLFCFISKSWWGDCLKTQVSINLTATCSVR